MDAFTWPIAFAFVSTLFGVLAFLYKLLRKESPTVEPKEWDSKINELAAQIKEQIKELIDKQDRRHEDLRNKVESQEKESAVIKEQVSNLDKKLVVHEKRDLETHAGIEERIAHRFSKIEEKLEYFVEVLLKYFTSKNKD